MTLIRTTSRISSLTLLACLAFFFRASAAEIMLQAPMSERGVGSQFTVKVSIGTGATESVNAISGTLIFPTDRLAYVGSSDGNSIVNPWIVRPHADGAGKITFSGIIPGGYEGARGFVAAIRFQALKGGTGSLSIASPRLLLDDGKGMPAAVTAKPLIFTIGGSSSDASAAQRIADTESPLPFVPALGHDARVFDGAYFLTFSTVDKGSGIDHYEVKEGDSSFVEAESPYLLKDQNRASSILVAAVDMAGNRRTVEYRSASGQGYAGAQWLIVALALIVISLYAYTARQMRNRRIPG